MAQGQINEDLSFEALDTAIAEHEDVTSLKGDLASLAAIADETAREDYDSKTSWCKNSTAPRRILGLRRQEYALRLRCSNPVMTYDEIAAQVRQRFGMEKYDRSQAYRDVLQALEPVRKNIAQFAVEFVALDAMRLEDMFQRVWEVAFPSGDGILDPDTPAVDLKAVDRLLRIQERRAKTLGIDNPDLMTLAAMTRPEGEDQNAKFSDDSARIAALVALLDRGAADES